MQPMTQQTSRKAWQNQRDQQLLATTTRQQQEPYFLADGRCYYPLSQQIAEHTHATRQLYRPRRCYVCKHHFWQVHHFYHLHCPTCAEENYSQRSACADLTGRIAVVTGGRIKIGFEIALKLLRAGAMVHVTTRFPHDAAVRFAQQHDYVQWSQRLIIHMLDLRALTAVEVFCDYLQQQLSHIDILINNAAQTIKKSDTYFAEMAILEQQYRQQMAHRLSDHHVVLGFQDEVWQAQQQQQIRSNVNAMPLDEFAEPVDCAATNSWGLTLETCSTQELIETQVVNAMAPFVLNSLLKHLLLRSPYADRFIVNVSAMEGQFNRPNKTVYHPHTNMAKASLNMLTRTAAQDYARDQIWMNSVDTGWVTQEHPLPKKIQQRERGMVPPLDCIDGAARVLAPIWQTLSGKAPVYGQFFKDYHPTEW
ncbi:MAG: SDR family oxidoreductase [Pseudomonadota bacterium]|nr:SDR family oxidoreductase [Pseudomonadota bacterium]